jgi:hypothetical protein
MGQPKTPEEREAYLKENAGLVWNIGTILEDRRDAHGKTDEAAIWEYLYENLDSIYEQVGPILDRLEDTIFGTTEPEEEEEEGWPYSKLKAFERVVIEYHGSGDEGWIEDIHPEPAIEGVAIDHDLYKELEMEAYNVLERHYAGWEINEGSQGHITIVVAERKAYLHHGTNREVTDWEDVVV